MNGKVLAFSTGLSALVLGSCGSGSPGSKLPEPRTESPAVAATATEQTLLDALNAERQKAGKPTLSVSSTLSNLAREDSATAAAAARFSNNTGQLRVRSGFGTMTKFQGTLKDRGYQTGKGFVEYWMKDQASQVTDDWSQVGAGISKSADGRLFAVVLLGRAGGGGGLMTPAMSPGGL